MCRVSAKSAGVTIRLQAVSKQFTPVTAAAPAIHRVNLEIESGRTTAVIGPSGCGKSTVLRLILGLIEPTCGTITITGEAVTRESALLLRRHIGYVVQDGGLFPHLTAAENVTLMAQHLGRAREWIDERLGTLCELVRLDPQQLHRFPQELSGGQRQRVSLMRALMLEPALLLLDEPLGALDPLIRTQMQCDLKSVFRELRQTVVLVTHDLAEAAFLSDSLVLMNRGEIVQHGTIGELREQPAIPFVRDFLNAQRPLVAW